MHMHKMHVHQCACACAIDDAQEVMDEMAVLVIRDDGEWRKDLRMMRGLGIPYWRM